MKILMINHFPLEGSGSGTYTKNLATRISCPVIASSNLQDGTCPPHTNLAPYNNLLSTDKEIYFYPLLQHVIPSDWPSKTNAFFKAHMK